MTECESCRTTEVWRALRTSQEPDLEEGWSISTRGRVRSRRGRVVAISQIHGHSVVTVGTKRRRRSIYVARAVYEVFGGETFDFDTHRLSPVDGDAQHCCLANLRPVPRSKAKEGEDEFSPSREGSGDRVAGSVAQPDDQATGEPPAVEGHNS